MRLVVICWLVLSTKASAGVVGDYSRVRNLPGYIGLSTNDDVYRSRLKVTRKRGDGIEHRTVSRILAEDYLTDNGSIDRQAITAKILQIKNHEQAAYLTYCVSKLPKKSQGHVHYCKSVDDKKIAKKWRQKKLATVYRYAINELEQARQLAKQVTADNINHPASQDFLEHLLQGLEVFESIKGQDPTVADLRNALNNLQFERMTIGYEVEAANLIIPQDLKEKYPVLSQQMFFSPEQLRRYQQRGLDLSMLDPVDSGMWRKPQSISNFDTTNYNNASDVPAPLLDPSTEISVTYVWGEEFTGRTPKAKVEWRGQRWKIKYLSQAKQMTKSNNLGSIAMYWRKYGHEVNTETVVNNLAAALGFTVSPTYYKRSVRLYFEQDDPQDVEEFDRLYQKMVDEQGSWRGYDPLPAFSDIQVDKQGRYYVRLRAVSIEKSSSINDSLGVGPYLKAGFSRVFRREFRAFTMFSAWVSDQDIKDGNVDLVLATTGDGLKVGYSASDMGHVLGSFFAKDAPNFFGRDLVAKVRRRPDQSIYELVLNYRTIMHNRGMDATSISDARWFTRLLVQLRPQQIKKAFLAAGYSEVISEYFSQLLLRRRDQLAETFALLGDTIVDNAGNEIVVKKESLMTDPDNYAVAGYEKYFKDGYFIDPDGEAGDTPQDFIRRYYDRSFRNAEHGTVQHMLWEALGASIKIALLSGATSQLNDLQLTNRTFGLPLMDGGFCTNECFYDGLRIGITNFVPQRHLLQNPYDNSESPQYPFLLADVYRFGFMIGADISEDYPSRFGLGELNDTLPALRYLRVYEFIKVKPIASVTDSLRNLKELSPLKILKYRNMQEQLVKDLQQGEALIASSYLSKGAGLQFGNYPFLFKPLVTTGIDINRITVNRTAFIKGEDNRFLVQFSDVAATKFWSGVKASAILVDFPVITYEMQKLSRSDLLYQFDLTNQDLAIENLTRISPSSTIQPFSVVERTIDNKKRKFGMLMAVAKFFLDEINTSTIEINADGDHRELHVSTVEEKRQRDFVVFSNSHTLLETFVTRDEQVFVKLRLNFSNYLGKRNHFAWVQRHMLPLLGRPFVLFTADDVNYYLDKFEFSGEIYIMPEGVNNILGQQSPLRSKKDFCLLYARSSSKALVIDGDVYTPRPWCQHILAGRGGTRTGRGLLPNVHFSRIQELWKRFSVARRSYRQVLADNIDRQQRHLALRKRANTIARLFASNNFHPTTWQGLQTIAGEDHIYRDALLTSRTGGFPGQSKRIEMPKQSRGGASKKVVEIFYRDIVQAVEIYSDPLFGKLQGVFYEDLGEDLIPDLVDVND